MKYCKYGCGKVAKFPLKSSNGKLVCCSKSPNSCEKNKEKNREGLKRAIEIDMKKPGNRSIPWNKGLTKETDARINNYGKNISKSLKRNNHQKGKKRTEQERKNISEGMKKAHKEGRANNWLDSKKDNNKSFPEIFFEEVIKNAFEDKNYEFQRRFKRFALDFSWPQKKKVIEIDGSQHERIKKQIENDIEKDKLLIEEGWKVLRIKWKDMFNDTKTWIQIANKFIGAST